MLDATLQRRAAGSPSPAPALSATALVAGWREGLAVVNLRGNAEEAGFAEAVEAALALKLPLDACSTVADDRMRIVWAGPDDWFVIGPKGQADAIAQALRTKLEGRRHALTDVSSGYTVLHLSGKPVREVLAQGCPLDLHPRAFGPGRAAGSHFFKAGVWLWQADEAPTYELLVRRSFAGYVWLMLQRASEEHGLVTRRFA